MTTCDWRPMPVGIDASRWVTRSAYRTVLVVAHTTVSAQRLLDVVGCVESDPRVQVVYTVAPDTFNRGVDEYLRSLGAVVLPWHQATRERFDLAMAAAYGSLNELHAPLAVMAHGAGHGKRVRPGRGGGPLATEQPVYGLDAQRLSRDGRVLPAALVLANKGDGEILRRQCPDALPVTVIAGDPCYDRLVASVPLRRAYRRAFDVDDGQRLVVVCSTWGGAGLFGNAPDLLPRLMDELPAARFRVGALLHPAVWGAHGRRQIRAWLADCREAGLILPDPTDDWRALMVAADYLIGDHGSVTAYGAAIGRPLLHLAPTGVAAPVTGSAQQLVTTAAPRLDLGAPLLDQLATARTVDGPSVTAAVTAHPGQATMLIRRTLYRLLGLPEPGRHRRAEPVPVPGS